MSSTLRGVLLKFAMQGMILNRVLAFYFYILARRLRMSGCYSYKTLMLFDKAYNLSPSPRSFLVYLLFKRDLGIRFSMLEYEKLQRYAVSLNGVRYCLAVGLLTEAREYLGVSGGERFQGEADCQLLPCLSNDPLLSVVHSRQCIWRREFLGELKTAASRGDSICIVGNSGIMQDCVLGSSIDGHGYVFRFNQYASGLDSLDIGKKCDVWVTTPGFEGKPPVAGQVNVAIMTGGDVRFRSFAWQHVYPVLKVGGRVLTVPLSVWHFLVEELGSPPSAGILLLYWLYDMLGSWNNVSVAGFGALSDMNAPYHATNRFKVASSRHNWEGEAVLLKRWLKEGLNSLHDSE